MKRVRRWSCRAAIMSGLSGSACTAQPANETQAQAEAQPNAASEKLDPADAAEFALGNTFFVMFHEVGHALIAEFELPVLGREEDAVDNFASVMLAPGEEDDERDSTILTYAIAGWFASAAQQGLEDIAWWDEHGPDMQRAYQIACLLYGSAEKTYDELADDIELPVERRERCGTEYQSTLQSWTALLAPYAIAEGTSSPTKITVSYDAAGGFVAERDMLRDSKLMEAVAEAASESFRLPRDLKLKGSQCGGEANAWWDPEAAEITICYELVRNYLELYAGLAAADGDGGS